MIIRVDWNGNSENVTVYQAGCYSVSKVFTVGTAEKPGEFDFFHLTLDNGAHELHLKGPGTAYIMNDQGKTIDVLRP
jgi:hypothetical protein